MPFPEHKSYTTPSKLSLIRLLVLLVSSSIKGRWFSKSARISNCVSVVLKSPMYWLLSGFAQIEAASIMETDFPPSVSPQRSTINGRAPKRLTRILAKDAARENLISNRPVLRNAFTCSSHSCQLPCSRILSYTCPNAISPSKIISVSYGRKPSPIQPSFALDL